VDLVALELGAGAAPTEALEEAASLGGGWPFARIRGALADARRARASPWLALEQLARQIGVPDLADLAAITASAGQEGAKILNALLSLAAAMRSRELAATQAKGASRTTIMTIPIAVAAGGFLVLLIFPALYRGFLAG
jgi:Flp pilus assembly protein TadB